MSPRIPGRLCLAGAVLFLLPWLTIHAHIPGQLVFNAICIPSSVCLLAGATFLSLYGFCISPQVRREFLAFCFLGSLLLAIQFFADYAFYSMINRTLNTSFDEQKDQILTRAFALTRKDPSPPKRAAAARVVYMMTGLQLPYRKDDLNWTYYEPTTGDKDALDANLQFEASVKILRLESKGFLAHAIDVVIYTFTTFLFGLLWLAVKRPVNPSDT